MSLGKVYLDLKRRDYKKGNNKSYLTTRFITRKLSLTKTSLTHLNEEEKPPEYRSCLTTQMAPLQRSILPHKTSAYNNPLWS